MQAHNDKVALFSAFLEEIDVASMFASVKEQLLHTYILYPLYNIDTTCYDNRHSDCCGVGYETDQKLQQHIPLYHQAVGTHKTHYIIQQVLN